ncbi:MAG: aminotransferase class I/II-fold pyridoxal phosphate-dependent enzyme, partial [Oscillospiraceae bacterium]|nr:aminotransferase class I/II-fold pyridoxal phosphate-dependent enzyme [Oscillospiraceae bacterium]
DDGDYVARVRALMRRERPRLCAGLRALGLYVVPGEANFLLFRCRTPLVPVLRERGILIRGCADFVGLDETWYRVAVRTEAENARLLAALGEVLG